MPGRLLFKLGRSLKMEQANYHSSASGSLKVARACRRAESNTGSGGLMLPGHGPRSIHGRAPGTALRLQVVHRGAHDRPATEEA